MKKVSLLVLLAILASTLLMAAIPTTVVRLTIINKSGFDVFMKLTGSAVTDAFYYLTIPSGDRDVPTVKVFTVMSDLYTRETWQCNGVRSTGTLIVDGNLRLTFTPCGERACSWISSYYAPGRCNPGLSDLFEAWELQNPGKDWQDWWKTLTDEEKAKLGTYYEVAHRQAGEPRMEKVTYFRYLTYGGPAWQNAYLYTGFWNFGCGTWQYRIRTYRLPYGCEWRYQY